MVVIVEGPTGNLRRIWMMIRIFHHTLLMNYLCAVIFFITTQIVLFLFLGYFQRRERERKNWGYWTRWCDLEERTLLWRALAKTMDQQSLPLALVMQFLPNFETELHGKEEKVGDQQLLSSLLSAISWKFHFDTWRAPPRIEEIQSQAGSFY